MAVTLDPKVKVALSNMFGANEVYESDKAKVLSAIDEALITADAAETQQLTELRGVVSKWNALPDPVKRWEYPGAAALQQALADASSSTLVDMTELFNLIKKIQQEAREGWQQERLDSQQNKLAMANAEKANADQAADERFNGAVAGAAADIASGVIGAVGGGLSLGKAAQSAKRQRDASKLTESIQEHKANVSTLEDLKVNNNAKIAELKAELKASRKQTDLAFKLSPADRNAKRSEIKFLERSNAKADKDLAQLNASPEARQADADEVLVKKIDRLISVDDSYSRALSTLSNAVASVASGTGKAITAVYTKTAEELDAERNQLGAFRDLYSTHEQTAAEFVQSSASTIEAANSALAGASKAAEDTGKNIVRNYN